MLGRIRIDKTLKLAKKAVIYEVDLTILYNDYRVFKPIENELVLFLALKLRMDFFNIAIEKIVCQYDICCQLGYHGKESGRCLFHKRPWVFDQ